MARGNGSIYPTLKLEKVKNPNRLFAIPLLGILIKVILLIPVFLELIILAIAFFFVWIINSFVVLFTGEYWNTAYTLTLGILRLTAKTQFYFFGLSDLYPGFDFSVKDFTLDIAKPEKPNRLFAIPLLGGIVRIIILIPYLIYDSVLQNAASAGVLISFFPVLTKGEYPESTYELARDYTRVNLAASCYMAGLSDSYPSFWISMNHKNIKIALIIVGVIISLSRNTASVQNKNNPPQFRYQKDLPSVNYR